MKNFRQLPYPMLLLWTLIGPLNTSAQTFTDLPGPMGTTRCFMSGQNGALYLGSSSKGVFWSQDQGQNWVGLGGNTIMTGRINEMAQDTNGQIFAATEQGGIKVWNGTAWNSFNSGLLTGCGLPIPIRSIVRSEAGQWFAGAHSYAACFAGGDIYRLEGANWVSIASGLNNTNINSLAIHPLNGQLYAGTEAGVFRFDGLSWTAENNGLSSFMVHKIKFTSNGELYAGTDAGLSKLTSNGASWVDLNVGLNGFPVYSISLTQNPQHLLIGTGYNQEQVGSLYGQLFETQDGGNSWIQLAPNLETTLINDLTFIGNETFLAAGWGIFKSIDNGQNWQKANVGFTAKTFNTQGRLAITPAPNRAIFYGTDDGVFRSLDEGESWTMASQGLDRRLVTLLNCDQQGNLFCGAMRYLGQNSLGFGDGMLYKSTDLGAHWSPVTISKDWRYMEISELPNGDLICAHGFGAQLPSASIVGSSLARSNDHGDTWTDLDVSSGMAFCCAASASGDLFVAGESQSVYRSTDGGASFDLIVVPGQSGNVGTLEVSPTGEMIMGSGGIRTLFFSADNGSNYEAFTSPVLPDYRGVSDVVFDDQGKAYCSSSGQGGTPSLFTISPPFEANSDFVAIPGLFGSFFKMTWDECGYLYAYRAGGILKSDLPLRMPLDDCLSGLNPQLEHRKALKIYPNPAQAQITLDTPMEGALNVQIFNTLGYLVQTEYNIVSGTTINIESLPAGIYLLRVKTGNQFFQQKLTKTTR